ncbi:MAG TPA: M3 family peptidase, partial [Anaeromyxobacteraceae bacterium]
MIATGLLTFTLLAAPAGGGSPPPASPKSPLLLPWAGPHGGVPPFDRLRVADLGPALEAAMAEQLVEVQRIADDPAPPAFDNTLVALERSGRALDRAAALFNVCTTTLADDAVQALEREMAPKLAAHRDRIVQNEKLFRRVAAVYEGPERARLDPEGQRLAWYWHD